MLDLLLIVNVIWFLGGYNVFWLRGPIFAKTLVAKEHRDTPVFPNFVHSGRFLGGFNLAFASLSLLLFLNAELFDQALQWSLLLAVIGLAHGTQFWGNLPVAIENRKGQGVWQVKGLMLFIFVVDFTLMMANFGLAIWLGMSPSA